jgi:hypothetical protein
MGQTQNEKNARQMMIEGHERALQALRLRAQGLGYQAIADALGYGGPSGAYQAVKRALERTRQEASDEVRTLELSRLDALLNAAWERAMSGDYKSIANVLSIMDRRAKYLGLDQAQKVDNKVTVEYVDNWRKVRSEDEKPSE